MPSSRIDTRRDDLARFRSALYGTFTRWGDALFELSDALLFAPGAITSIPQLSLEPVFSRSHGSLYKALDRGRIDTEALRHLLVAHRPTAWPMLFAVDASTFDRCDAETSPERGFYYSASKHSAGQPIVAGWSYQWICQLDWAPDSWTAPVDAMRITVGADATTATVDQVRRLVGLLPNDAEVPLFVFDAGYDAIALGHELTDLLPVRVPGEQHPDAITAGPRDEEGMADGQQRLAFVWVRTQHEQRDRLAGPFLFHCHEQAERPSADVERQRRRSRSGA